MTPARSRAHRAAVLVALGLLAVAGAAGADEPADDEVSLPSVIVTEGATPATELEATATASRAREGRAYGVGISSAQYAPVPWLGVKLAVPLAVLDPREGPTVAGIGDASLMLKWTPVLLPASQAAVGGGLRLGLPTGSERRGLGGMLTATPFLVAGRAFALGGLGRASVQGDLGYTWQLDRPARPEADAPDDPRPPRPDRAQTLAVDLAATWSPVPLVTAIVELNHVTVVRGDDALRERPQLYVTPGLGLDPGGGWNVRAGVQLPVTRARAFEHNIVVIVTRSF